MRRRLHLLRESRGLTREELARRAGLGEKFYQNLEEGRAANPTLSTLNRLAEAPELPLYALLYDPQRLREALEGSPG